ncbi:3-hydroxyacyl-CoA dehydrogenase family protein [Bacillus sp. DJP31]|uniref:3-hydroxyacyl-CoA dehydrogenase family protein n=1 Tax=Bacillus sp. DJP31 TaxID=3409789 RepID=UPI003BB6395D
MSELQINRIVVVGAGQMGHQIGMLAALGGYETIIQDSNEAAIQKAKISLNGIMTKWVEKGRLTEEQMHAAFERLQFTTQLEEAARNADFVIEAVVEKLEVKREVFQLLDKLTPPHTILASNSSTIVSSLLAEVTSRPDKVCNMHFFFPPLVMDCVEVVMSEQTSEETAKITMEVCKQLNRTGVLLKKEVSGFIANRILGALQREAVSLYESGIADFKDIDIICRKALNHPIGPFELMDLSGIDIGYYVMQQRFAETGDPADQPPQCIQEKVEQGHLGRKTGKGFYDYEPIQVKR